MSRAARTSGQTPAAKTGPGVSSHGEHIKRQVAGAGAAASPDGPGCVGESPAHRPQEGTARDGPGESAPPEEVLSAQEKLRQRRGQLVRNVFIAWAREQEGTCEASLGPWKHPDAGQRCPGGAGTPRAHRAA